jgi:UDP-N-acetylglucosamine 2-epimerase (non-hydrolysing)
VRNGMSSGDRVKVLFVFGTRPEAIKVAPVIRRLRTDGRFEVGVCTTGQHRSMTDDVLQLFAIHPDHDLDVMREAQSPAEVTTAVLDRLAPVLQQERPHWVIVQGDTTSTFAASLAAFYARIPVAHLEAGLRTGDPASPFPEEMNRLLTSRLASVHFAPTEAARANLAAEGVTAQVYVCGNTVIDALLDVESQLRSDAQLRARSAGRFAFLDEARPLLLATAHRRESFGEGIAAICRALVRIAHAFPAVQVVLPVHPNPAVREPVREALGGVPGIHLVDPLDYATIVDLMTRARFILTDSGGIQEEAPALGKAVLVMRDKTERMEGVGGGNALLVGTGEEAIVAAASALLTDPRRLEAMSRRELLYGDGSASARIADILARVSAAGL